MQGLVDSEILGYLGIGKIWILLDLMLELLNKFLTSKSRTGVQCNGPLPAIGWNNSALCAWLIMVPGAGIEPACLTAGDFESPASTNFTTRALGWTNYEIAPCLSCTMKQYTNTEIQVKTIIITCLEIFASVPMILLSLINWYLYTPWAKPTPRRRQPPAKPWVSRLRWSSCCT